MLTFAAFLLAAAVYVVVLLWCLAPLLRMPSGTDWVRLIVGVLLVGGNLSPGFVFPLVWPVGAISPQLAEKLIAVTMFGRTLPFYIANIAARGTAIATTVELEFPITIGKAKYLPRLTLSCTHRRALSIDKFVSVSASDKYPTLIGGDFVAKADSATLVIGPPNNFCSPTPDTMLAVGPYPRFGKGFGLGPSIFVVRGEADRTQLYELRYDGKAAVFEDLTLEQPRIVSVEKRTANQVVPLDALWPMALPGERRLRVPALASAYASVRGCVEFNSAGMDFKTLTMTTHRRRKNALRDVSPPESPAYCVRELARRIPQSDPLILQPVGN
jgi:hypothetical protein